MSRPPVQAFVASPVLTRRMAANRALQSHDRTFVPGVATAFEAVAKDLCHGSEAVDAILDACDLGFDECPPLSGSL